MLPRFLSVTLPLSLGLVGIAAAPATAAEPVEIVVNVPFGGGSIAFEATGASVCDSGVVQDSETRITGVQGPSRALTFHLDRTFVCDDGSGTFTIRLKARWLPCAPQNAGTWAVLRGDGDYASLHGAGVLEGTYQGSNPCDPSGIVDVLTGRLALG